LEVVLDPSEYSTSCSCGIITTWMFFAWRAGTVVFYVLDGRTVKGTSSFNIGELLDKIHIIQAKVTLTYTSPLSESTYYVELAVSDGCNGEVTGTKIYQSTSFYNCGRFRKQRPGLFYTFTATDPSGPSGDSLTCSLYDTNPDGGPFSISQGVPNVYGEYNIVQSASPGYTYSTKKYYDLRISCTDGVTTVYSNFQVDVVKNEAPTFTAGSSGYVPGSISVDRTAGTSIYQLIYSDAESDTVSFTDPPTCSDNGHCPFAISGTGEITTNAVLEEEGYNLDITIRDNYGNAETHSLSVVTSGRPYTFNEAPIWRNLPATKYVMENTPVGTSLFKVIYTDENPTDTFTMANVSPGSDDVNTYFQFDATTGIISIKEAPDYERPFTDNVTMSISINDGTLAQHNTVIGTITFVVENVNEGITLSITNTALTADETNTRGTAFTPNPGISATDIDAGDNMYFTMDCGDDSKYFYLDTATNEVKFAREYDMDSGLSGTATCNVTVRDEAGMSDSGLITLTINNVNDHVPKFPHHIYVFFVSTTTPFFTEIADMAATDLDSDAFGSTNGVLTYSFSPASPTGDYFQMNAAGVLFVRDVTSYTGNTYVFEIIAADSGGLQGTCTVTIIFSPVITTTTSTTERTLKFEDDYQNYIWLFLLGCGIFACIVVILIIVWKDPVVNEYMNYKMYKLCEWCRKKPKPKKPRRHVEKLRVMINKKDLENDPDNALPWELLAKDNDEPKVNEVQEMIKHRSEKRDRDYKNFAGLPVFERGKGSRPESGRATVHSSASSAGRPDSESPKYATFMSSTGQEEEDGGEGQWGDLTERRVIITPVAPVPEDNGNDRNKGEAEDLIRDSSQDW
ncbi:protocadherin Fat 4-like, partial [Ruditapes philippinarum]|uniref:protocadherin Fat 4-like n=1 Tax=Ruditapes philippinarum TaxID=129788 RepID=UPI00295BF782